MHELVNELEKAFKNSADLSLAKKQSAYMRNLFSYFGLPKPIRASLQKPILKKYFTQNESETLKILQLLWEKEEREFQYAALDLAAAFVKFSSEKMLPALELMVRKKSWWDTVDAISGIVGKFLLKHQNLQDQMDTWIEDSNLWIKRTALIFQLKWKERTDQERLFAYCSSAMHESDFFIRKAIGWALREYSKTNPLQVKNFIEKNYKNLSPLSIKEASRYL